MKFQLKSVNKVKAVASSDFISFYRFCRKSRAANL